MLTRASSSLVCRDISYLLENFCWEHVRGLGFTGADGHGTTRDRLACNNNSSCLACIPDDWSEKINQQTDKHSTGSNSYTNRGGPPFVF